VATSSQIVLSAEDDGSLEEQTDTISAGAFKLQPMQSTAPVNPQNILGQSQASASAKGSIA